LNPRERKQYEARENVIMRSFIICTLHRMFISWSRRWVGHVAYTGETINAYTVLDKNLKGRDRLGDLGIDGMIISKSS
jgi:hypothetical protein